MIGLMSIFLNYEYNLNIPRYVDSSEAAESWDIYASMFGGLPLSEIDELKEYWIADMDIALPKVQEQRAISGYFEHLDSLITLHQRKLEKLQNIKKSMLEKMFV
ncbi:MAG: hypothetical protein MR922_09690 [Lachnospiraceae bacterium]|nr:hypothetical protein [Lachnospiraceae bacterium]